MLEVMRSYFGVSSAGMHREIRGMVTQTVQLLAKKGVDYKKLQKALVPQPNRREVALIFDTQRGRRAMLLGMAQHYRTGVPFA